MRAPRFTRAAIIGVAAVLAAPVVAAIAAPVDPGSARTGSLTQVGPLADHGFPAWYRDSNGVRLEACTTLDDPLCATLPDEVPNPDEPVSYPGNFPGEFFYQLAGAEMTLANGVDFGIGLDLEGAWAAEEVRAGDQMVFGRVRIRFDAPEGERYRITHPYGADEITAGDRGVNMTEDIGAVPGAFGEVFKSRIGPFLVWDPAVAPAAPAGYTGDPGVEHRVIGSPYGTNFVEVERIDAAGNVLAELGRTDLFSIQGRYAGNAGVDLDQATYAVGDDGSGFIEVFATSEPGQAIQVSANPALGLRTTALRGQGGRYYGRFAVTGVPESATVEVVNASDQPVARKSRKLIDVVSVTTADYDADTQTLVVMGSSTDQDDHPAALTVTGFGPLVWGEPFTGVTAPPAAITVTSTSGGTVTVPLSGYGAGFLPGAPVAAVVAPAVATVSRPVTLDGTGSTGEIDAYGWSQTAGPEVTLGGAATATATFTPAEPGTYGFELMVSGPGGTGAPMTVTVEVSATVEPIEAAAGPDQTVRRGLGVTLDASATRHAETFSWVQKSGPAATLTGAATAKPTFTYPLMPLPAGTGPNPSYVADNAPLVFEVTVTGPGGTDTDEVVVSPQPETISNVTARYRTGKPEWRIDGTSSLVAGQRVTVVLGSTLTGPVIGTATVDASGAFSLRPATPNPGAVRTVSIVSATGGRLLGVTLTVTT
jgi:hypothetical protein